MSLKPFDCQKNQNNTEKTFVTMPYDLPVITVSNCELDLQDEVFSNLSRSVHKSNYHHLDKEEDYLKIQEGSLPSEKNFKNLDQKNNGKNSQKLEYFDSVIEFLCKWLAGKPVSAEEVDLLDSFHARLICSIINRKFGMKNDSEVGMSCNEALKRLLLIKQKKVKKRTEENNKFVFKHVLRLMKLDFCEKRKIKSFQTESDKLFYQFYFSSTHNQKSNEADFNDLFKNKNKNCLSLDTLQNAFNCSLFTLEFKKILNESDLSKNRFVSTYLNSVNQKTIKLFKKWEKFYQKDSISCKSKIIEYFNTNKQCKLPWSLDEIACAIECIKKHIPNNEQEII